MIDVMKDPRYAHIPKKYKRGNCYKDAIDWMLQHGRQKHFLLCHGWVSGKGVTAGTRFSHAWIENAKTGNVVDPSVDRIKPLILPMIVYYAIGNIIPERVHRYSFIEMMNWLERTKKAGPWQSDFDE